MNPARWGAFPKCALLAGCFLAGCGGSIAGTSPSVNTPPSVGAPAAASPKPAGSGQASTKVIISQPSNSLGQAPLMIAVQKNLFQQQGLQVEVLNAGSGTKNAAAVIGGSSNIGMGELGDPLGAVEGGQDIRVFAATSRGQNVVLVLRRAVAERLGVNSQMRVVDRMKLLKGLKIAISTPGAGTDTNTRYLLTAAGMDPERDVQLLSTGTTENSLAAYVQGAADAAMLPPPLAQQALLNFDAIAAWDGSTDEIPGKAPGTISGGLWAPGKWLDANQKTAVSVVAAMWKSYDYIRANVQETGDIVHAAAWETVDPKIFDLAWKDNVNTVALTPDVTSEGMEGIIEYISATRGKKVNVTPDQLGTNKFVELAKQQLGK